MSWDTPEVANRSLLLEMTNLTTGAVYTSGTTKMVNPTHELSLVRTQATRFLGEFEELVDNGTSWATIFTQPVTYTLGGARLASEEVSLARCLSNPSR